MIMASFQVVAFNSKIYGRKCNATKFIFMVNIENEVRLSYELTEF